ncbi:MFS transporter, DHA2 family, multidrug resistance protein [Streptoalloteichus tenebrarius]|uniref:MFS transporter, DHA2 family, multidrug resistance protein n=1 Tax=Streptoalloteichus tenebrarius (strain ATCC 17920 / DSM 40477 / JCM 4838 / CBS 697.72 / NBRC 16177 / NCIMB 11028 / NRRL B-12390 / A12253. 1 / ISP 5477) TaxID=1933 RepID=A0ABT1I3A7_STRSD|nr:MFS transporter [Streptoalloteichus tenebrarius]MCP2262196.1 MFS transporter, DHA2 family, multidrug resistance protein [Streptoalloteichus tenebrarius]BFE98966.1 MFS transporter [Streptoalloteichus tenebrarius]
MRVDRAGLALAVLMLPTLLVALDTTALLLALPQLSADLGATSVQQLWISDSYGFMVTGLVITMGTLGDRIGRRRLLLIGAAAFAALSVVAAVADGPLTLIVARALLGVAGATLAPSTLALITNMFRDERRRRRAIALWATCQFTGGALGPVLAGFLLQRFWWGSVFLVAVPAMLVLLLTGPFLLPEFRSDQAGRLDLTSVGLSLVAVLLMVYGVKQLTVESAPIMPLAALVVGAAVGFLFVRRQLRLETPLLELRLFRDRPFTAVILALVFAGIAMAGTGLLVTQYLQGVLDFSPFVSAVLFAPMGLGVAVGTMGAPALTRWMRPTTAIAGGLAGSALGSLLLVGVGVDGGSALPLVMTGIAVLALGPGPLFALGTGLIVGSVPPDRAGSAASMSETGNYFGGSLGFALLGVVAAVVYRTGTDGTSDSLAGAVAASRHLPAAQGAQLLRTAREAFTTSLHVTGVVAAVIFAGMAVLILTMRPATHTVPIATPGQEVTHA